MVAPSSSSPWADGPIGELVARARRLAADVTVVNPGGGNFSVEGTLPSGERVLWISGWGSDAATLEPADCACLRVGPLFDLFNVPGVSNDEMAKRIVEASVHAMGPRPAIETLTHAFVPATHVDHTHPEAVIALTAVPNSRRLAAEAFGDTAFWLDYRQFDADLARELGRRVRGTPGMRWILMANHGLIAWGDTSETCYEATVEAVERAQRVLGQTAAGRRGLPPAHEPVPDARADELLAEALPVLRGLTSTPRAPLVATVNRGQLARRFACSTDGPQLALNGPACPDSLGRTRPRPLVLRFDPTRDNMVGLCAAVRYGVEGFRDWERGYRARHAAPGATGESPTHGPRVVVAPGIGVIALAEDERLARLAHAHFEQTMRVIEMAAAAGGYSSLTEAQAFADESWPMLYGKPQLRPAPGPLAGRVVAVGGGVIGPAAVARALASLGAHVVAGRPDEDFAVVVRRAVLAFGGIDVVVHLAGTGAPPAATMLQEALPVFRAQGGGGAIVTTGAEPEVSHYDRPQGIRACTVADTGAPDIAARVAAVAAGHVAAASEKEVRA